MNGLTKQEKVELRVIAQSTYEAIITAAKKYQEYQKNKTISRSRKKLQ